MIAYFLNQTDLSILDVKKFEKYEFNQTADYDGKSKITVLGKPNSTANDFIYVQDDKGTQVFQGIVHEIADSSDSNEHEVTIYELPTMFDRKLALTNEGLISATGIEDFIASAITNEWISSNDSLMNLSYLCVSADTHTKLSYKPDCDNTIYNMKTFLGNCLEYYGIFLDFTLAQGNLKISINKRSQASFNLDADVSDVTDYEETYTVDDLAKLTVLWQIPDEDLTTKQYFLLADRTISTDITDTNRASGTVSTVYIEEDTEAEMYEQACNQFTSNSYQHSVTCNIKQGSKIYEDSSLYVGHTATIKTKAHGTKSSIITSVTRKNTTLYTTVKFGNMAITLLEKLKKDRK